MKLFLRLTVLALTYVSAVNAQTCASDDDCGGDFPICDVEDLACVSLRESCIDGCIDDWKVTKKDCEKGRAGRPCRKDARNVRDGCFDVCKASFEDPEEEGDEEENPCVEACMATFREDRRDCPQGRNRRPCMVEARAARDTCKAACPETRV